MLKYWKLLSASQLNYLCFKQSTSVVCSLIACYLSKPLTSPFKDSYRNENLFFKGAIIYLERLYSQFLRFFPSKSKNGKVDFLWNRVGINITVPFLACVVSFKTLNIWNSNTFKQRFVSLFYSALVKNLVTDVKRFCTKCSLVLC